MSCRRCQGFMVQDWFFDSNEKGHLMAFWGWRCISCGEIIDPVILANRANPPVPRKRHPRYPRLSPPVYSDSVEMATLQ